MPPFYLLIMRLMATRTAPIAISATRVMTIKLRNPLFIPSVVVVAVVTPKAVWQMKISVEPAFSS